MKKKLILLLCLCAVVNWYLKNDLKKISATNDKNNLLTTNLTLNKKTKVLQATTKLVQRQTKNR
jgi:hypothetical protein